MVRPRLVPSLFSLGLVFLLFSAPTVRGESLQVGPFQLVLGKGFTLPPAGTDPAIGFLTPGRLPISVVEMPPGTGQPREAQALTMLLANISLLDPRVLPEEHPQETQIKREGAWTTIYWTYGGTKAYFGMYWGGGDQETGTLLFWAHPVKAPGWSQYQALSEVIRGIKVQG